MNMPFRSEFSKYLILSAIMVLGGMLFYGFYNKLIIIRLPLKGGAPLAHRQAHKKQTRIWYWDGEHLVHDDKKLIFSEDTQVTLTNLVASWLSLLDEEQLLSKKVVLQSVMLDPQNTTAYISFDQSPFKKSDSTYTKLMAIEGLLRTMRESKISLTKVQLLGDHTPLADAHLDFSHPWTLTGYASF
jgi:hypothetical protein